MSKSKAPLIEVLLAKVLERRGWKCKLLPKRKRVGLGAKAATGVVGAALGWVLPDLLRGPQAESLLQTLAQACAVAAQACAVAAQQCRPPVVDEELPDFEAVPIRCAECGCTLGSSVPSGWAYAPASRTPGHEEGRWFCPKCSINEHTEAPATAAAPSPST
jgi:hypothetical protein